MYYLVAWGWWCQKQVVLSKTSGGCRKRVVGVENEWCMLKKGGVVLKTGVVWLKMSGVVENRWGGCRKQVVWCRKQVALSKTSGVGVENRWQVTWQFV